MLINDYSQNRLNIIFQQTLAKQKKLLIFSFDWRIISIGEHSGEQPGHQQRDFPLRIALSLPQANLCGGLRPFMRKKEKRDECKTEEHC